MPSSAEKLQPAGRPVLDVPVSIDRAEMTIEIAPAQLDISPSKPAQVRWVLEKALLPDELLVIFGKRRCWTGDFGPAPERLPIAESAISTPLELGPDSEHVLSGPIQAELLEEQSTAIWLYGVVLVRGRDAPWLGEAHLRLELLRS